MRIVIVGSGLQGEKRRTSIGPDVVGTVDPVRPADFQDVRDVPLHSFDAACVCTPDEPKLDLLTYLLGNRKHVLVEKPLLGPQPGLCQLQELAWSKQTLCYTAYNHRFEPAVQRLKETLDRGEIGDVIAARFFYGNGTAHDVRRSPWRDKDFGVIADLGSHLIDLAGYLGGRPAGPALLASSLARETVAPDHCVFAIHGPVLFQFEATYLSWRNTFTIDVLGTNGTAHVEGLCKWGPASFVLRQRVHPSGKPLEWAEHFRQSDSSWAREHQYFQALCRTGRTDFENDVWINALLSQLRPGSELRIPR